MLTRFNFKGFSLCPSRQLSKMKKAIRLEWLSQITCIETKFFP
jgi:hypothetical protein